MSEPPDDVFAAPASEPRPDKSDFRARAASLTLTQLAVAPVLIGALAVCANPYGLGTLVTLGVSWNTLRLRSQFEASLGDAFPRRSGGLARVGAWVGVALAALQLAILALRNFVV